MNSETFSVVFEPEEIVEGLNINVTIENGYGSFTKNQVQNIINYCLKFGNKISSIPSNFNLMFNGLLVTDIRFTYYNEIYVLQGIGNNFDFQIEANSDFNTMTNYILFF